MIKVGDFVHISPAHTLKFADWRGRVEEIDHSDGLPIKVRFFEGERAYGFSHEEVVKIE